MKIVENFFSRKIRRFYWRFLSFPSRQRNSLNLKIENHFDAELFDEWKPLLVPGGIADWETPENTKNPNSIELFVLVENLHRWSTFCRKDSMKNERFLRVGKQPRQCSTDFLNDWQNEINFLLFSAERTNQPIVSFLILSFLFESLLTIYSGITEFFKIKRQTKPQFDNSNSLRTGKVRKTSKFDDRPMKTFLDPTKRSPSCLKRQFSTIKLAIAVQIIIDVTISWIWISVRMSETISRIVR